MTWTGRLAKSISAADGMEIRLEISHGQASVRNITLGSDSTIGRSSSCSLRIAASVVSRRHCRIYISDSGVLLRDLNSSNGTFINGQRVPPGQDVSLPAGCELSIGGIMFTVRYDPLVPAVLSQESTIEIPNLDIAALKDRKKLQPETSLEVEPATDTQELVGTAGESADENEMDRDTDYDPAASSDDTGLSKPDAALPGPSVDHGEEPPIEAAAQGETKDRIDCGFPAEAETNDSEEPNSNPDDDGALGDSLNQL